MNIANTIFDERMDSIKSASSSTVQNNKLNELRNLIETGAIWPSYDRVKTLNSFSLSIKQP